jgi:hypothetical protein
VSLAGTATVSFACAVVLVAFAQPASAGTVAVTYAPYGDPSVQYTAAAGEHNDVTVTASVDGIAIDDAGAEVTAGRGCDQIGAHRAICDPLGEGIGVRVEASDQDDVVRAIREPGADISYGASGGEGDDRLEAPAGNSLLDGGPGADTLTGGAGVDNLYGGPGGDTIAGGGGNDLITPDDATVGSDVVDGGDGQDSITYADRTTPVDVDLERATGNGAAGENDTIREIETVIGGGASDHLRGDDNANVIAGSRFGAGPEQAGQRDAIEGRGGDDRLGGGSGNDVISGGAGRDVIEGGGGVDAFYGGSGADDIDLSDESIPRALRCGGGSDLVNYPRGRQLIRPECETVQVDDFFFLARARLRAPAPGVRVLDISGLRGLSELPCRVLGDLVGIGGGQARLGHGAVRLPKQRDRATLRLHLTARGRRVLGPARPARVRLVLRGQDRCRPKEPPNGSSGFELLAR